MTLLSTWDNPNLPNQSNIVYNEIWGWADSLGNEYAIMGSLEWTYFIDITNPANPIVRDSVLGKFNQCIHRDFKTYGKYCYGVADEGNTSTLQIMDMSYLPDSVHVVYDSNQFFVRAHNIFIDEPAGRLYAVGTDAQNQGVIILDLTNDPEKPSLAADLNLGVYTHDLYVRHDTAYMNNGTAGLAVVDFTNLGNPSTIAQYVGYPGAGYNHSSWLTDDSDYLVICDETHNTSPQVLDVSDLNNISQASSFRSKLLFPDSASIPHNPLIAGNYAVLSYYHDGVQLFDISDRSNPVQIAWYDTQPSNTNYAGFQGCWGVYPFLPSGTVIASDILNGLYVLRVGFPFPYALQTAVQTSPVTCPGGNDGAAFVSTSGGTPPYSYNWSTGHTTSNPTNLTGGNHTVTVTDRYGYTFVDTVHISAPGAFLAYAQIGAESCPGVADGSISLLVIGGTPSYSYLWSTGDMIQNINGLTAGTYSVTITDSLNCAFTNQFAVTSSSPGPTANGGNDQTLCTTSTQLSATPPLSPATGQWQLVSGSGTLLTANSPTTNLVGLGPGENRFAWIVTEGVCTDVDTVSVYVSAAAFVNAGPDQSICGNMVQLNGSSPGTGTVSWTGSGLNLSSSNAAVTFATASNPGSYALAYTMTDAGCTATDSVQLNFEFLPDANFGLNIIGPTTVSFSDFSLYADSIRWDFGDGGTSTQPNPTYSYLNGGVYPVCLLAHNSCGTDTFCQNVDVFLVGQTGLDEVGLHLYPNPAQDRVTLTGQGLASGRLKGRLYNAQGQSVYAFERDIQAGQFQEKISLLDLPTGIYLLEVQMDGLRKVLKLLRSN